MTGGFPLDKFVQRKTGEADPPEVLELMQRAAVTPSHRHPLFAPAVTIHMKDGRSFTKQGTGREFIFNFDELVNRIGGIAPDLPVPVSQYAALVDACRNLDGRARADELVGLSVIQA